MKSKLYFGFLLVHFFLVVEITNAQSDTVVWAWAKSLSATNGIYGHSIALDPNGSGDIYVAGGFEGLTDFDPGPGILQLSSGSPDNVAPFVFKFDKSCNLVWARAMPSVGFSAGSIWDMAIDPSGSGAIYITGRFEGTIDFDPGPVAYNLTSVQNSNDIFISKLDEAGNFQWVRVMGGTGHDYGLSLAIDPISGDVYATGRFTGKVDFDPGDSTFNITSKGGTDIFISKLNSLGEFQWTKTIGGTGNDAGCGIAFAPTGNGRVFTTGQFYGKVDFDPGDGTDTLMVAPPLQENFISVLDRSGNFVWAKQIGKTKSLPVTWRSGSIILDPDEGGGVYITAPYTEKGDFDPGPNVLELPSFGDQDIFTAKFSRDGEFKWAAPIGGPNRDEAIGTAVQSGKYGGVFTLGMFKGTAQFDLNQEPFKLTSDGEEDMFITKYDTSGHIQWVQTITGPANAAGQSIATDNLFVYVSGGFFGTAISLDSFTLTNINPSGADLFMAKLNLNSHKIFVKDDATGDNNGTSWENAFTKLQTALDTALTGDEIWIAKGTYIPEGPSPDSSHFIVKKGVEMYGGFNGTESSLGERNLWQDTTTLSGDILGDDLPATNRSDNAHHVLIINSGDGETALDGLKFSGGSVGALYIQNTTVKIGNCIFYDNDGSGMYAINSDSISNILVIKNSTFEQNRGSFGAGIFLDGFNSTMSHYEIDSCIFNNNISSAGTIYSTSDSISQNISIIKNSKFINNIGNYGGGAIFSQSENLIIENCNFEGNYARLYPGCICPSGGIITFINPSSAHIAIRKTIFNNNDVDEFGDGVVIIFGGYAEFENVLFHGNYGYSSILSQGNIRLSNITMVDNQGGLIVYGNPTEIQNSIFDNETANFSYWGGSEIISKGGNISSDSTMAPVLMGYNGYADLHQTDPLLDADFVPLSNSPCIDAGDPEGVVSLYDLAGNPRFQGQGIDAGAYESPFTVAVKDAIWDSQDFKVFPNPVKDVLTFELKSNWIGNIRISVYNIQGQPVYNSEMNKSGRIQTFREKLNQLPPGEYVVLTIAGKTTYATKVIFL